MDDSSKIESSKIEAPGAAWSVQRLDADRSREARRKSRRKWIRRGIWASALVGLGALGVVAVIPKPIPVDVVAVQRRAMRVTVDEAGRARVRDRYIVSAPFAGNLGRIELRAGDPIEEGRPVATLVPAMPSLLDPRARAAAEARVASAHAVHRQSEAARRRAEAALEDARRELGTARVLVAGGGMARDALARAELEARMREEELASSRFATQVASSEITAARAGLGLFDKGAQRAESFEVPAPVSGRILRVLHPDAGVVAAGTPLLEVGDPVALEVVIDVLTADAARIVAGAPATLDAWGGPSLAAHVRRVEPSAFTRLSALGVEEQRVSVLLDLGAPRQAWATLGDGWRIEARVEVWSKSDALVVPSGVVFRSGDGWAAFVVANGRAVKRSVRIGERGGAEAEVIEGLGEGEVAILHPSERIEVGGRVAAR